MADFKYITETGVIVPDTADLKSEVESEWRNSFGADLRVTSDTPQGVMIAAETAARSEVLRTNAAVANQINPNIAGGVYLDAICALLGLEREQATRTLVRDVQLNGHPSTVIPAGVRAKTAADSLFESVGGVVLDSSGVAFVDFQSVDLGPIACAIGALNQVVDSVLGWETVTNASEGIPGVAEQSDESLRELRRRTLARQGISTVEAQVSDLNAIPNVRSIQFRENTAATTQVIDGISMVAHSIWACVDGGTDAEVAASLLTNKTNGAAYNGAVTVNVVEPNSGQAYPVKFDRPTVKEVLVRVSVRQGTSTADPQIAVRDAVMAYVNGEVPGERGFVVGGPVSPFEIAGGISFALPGMFVSKVEVSHLTPVSWQTTELAIAINEVAQTQSSSITVIEL
jgi:uncharacterized phage protein gp47/JayE